MMNPAPRHIVLAGDSIFDNDSYVPGGPGVIEQMRQALPPGWSAVRIAVDGDCIRDVPAQLARLPAIATDLVLSIGGNDMLSYAHLLSLVRSPDDLPRLLEGPLSQFGAAYGALLDTLGQLSAVVTVCTVYTDIPFPDPQFRRYVPPAIAAFNDVIRTKAAERKMSVIDLARVCTEPGDFSAISPIEPSAAGGEKIVAAILEHLAARGR